MILRKRNVVGPKMRVAFILMTTKIPWRDEINDLDLLWERLARPTVVNVMNGGCKSTSKDNCILTSPLRILDPTPQDSAVKAS